MSYKRATANSLKKYSIGDRDFLNKRLKTTTRYTKVKSRTNSGFNATRRQEIEKEIRKYYRVRNDEVFQRISLGDLLHLMVIYAEESNLTRLGVDNFQKTECEDDDDKRAEEEKKEVEEKEDNVDKPVPLKFRDDIHEVVHRMEEMDLLSTSTEDENRAIPCPFLILDVRAGNEFIRGHLATAICHPHSRLSRAVGWECPEMLAYKNHSDWIIIICDENETLSSEVAGTLIHRGYTNTFVLSGGLTLARDKIGPPLVTTDKGKTLSPAVAEFLVEKLSNVLIPPLRMDGAASWWVAKTSNSRRSVSQDSGLEGTRGRRSTSRGRTPQEEKKKPWK